MEKTLEEKWRESTLYKTGKPHITPEFFDLDPELCSVKTQQHNREAKMKNPKTKKQAKNDAYTNQVKAANPYIKKVAKQATEPPQKLKRADLVKEIESLKDWNAKQRVEMSKIKDELATANDIKESCIYSKNRDINKLKNTIKTAETLVEFKDEQIDILSVENFDSFRNKSTWVFAFIISSMALIATNIWRFI